MTSASTAIAASITNFLKAVQPSVSDSTFNDVCINNLLNNATRLLDVVFVDGDGNAINASLIDQLPSSSIWGIGYRSCEQYCGWSSTHLPFSYPAFSGAMTNYLLPWLALTAQLPYETGSTRDNFLALFISLGSPVLIAYSLALTLMNINSLKRRLRHLLDIKGCPDDYPARLGTIHEVLSTAQHVPLRANQSHGWLSSLLVLKSNVAWWDKVREHFRTHVRDFTPSALAQLAIAIVAWILTTVAALAGKLGDPNTALQNASGSLWLWLVPVVIGYIKIGVPNSSKVASNAFEKEGARNATALNANRNASDQGAGEPVADRVAVDRADVQGTNDTGIELADRARRGPQDVNADVAIAEDHAPPAAQAIAVKHDARLQHGILTNVSWFTTNGTVSHYTPTVWSRSLLGDADIPGAAYTYARSLQFPFFVELIVNALQHSIVEEAKHGPANNDNADADEIAEQCGMSANMKLNPFPSWTQISADSWYCMIAASIIALVVQWGTLLASFELAYTTPVWGIGCRSGSYLVYGACSTFAWIVLVIAQFCSNEAMRIEQEIAWAPAGSDERPLPLDTPEQRLRRRSTREREGNQTAADRSGWRLALCKRAAVGLRLFGKLLCILNTAWLLATSICEIIGVFDQCWCAANRPSTSADNGYVVLFKSATDLASSAISPWWGGFAMSLFFVSLTGAIFWLGSSRELSA